LGLNTICSCADFNRETLAEGIRLNAEKAEALKEALARQKTQWRVKTLSNAIMAAEISFGVKNYTWEQAEAKTASYV
jgi:hypothetical protein